MSVLLTVKDIFATKLLGIVPWSSVAVTNSTGQELYADIETPKGHKYKLSVKTSYSAPPLGAVTLFDGTDPKNPSELVHGQNQDATWYRVTEYVKAKEAGSSAEVAAKVAAVVPEHLQVTVAPPAPDDVEIPDLGFVYFIAGRGEFYRNGPALVTRRLASGALNLSVFPEGSEVYYQENVQPRSDTLRNHCFVEYPSPGAIDYATVKEMIAEVLDVTKFDCSEAVNEALHSALPGIVAAAKAELEHQTGIREVEFAPSAPTTDAEAPAPQIDADHSLEELERLTAPDPAPQA